jgi:signal transduction histidine kinase
VVRERGFIQEVDLNASLDQALAQMADKIKESGARVSHTALPRVSANPQHLSVVFENLLANAIKYRKPDVTPDIRISAVRASNEWLVTVTDNGIGFSPLHEERIFGLFKRLHRDAYPGTGLGLAICRSIVEQYGGQIWAHSDGDGMGATFTLSFPVISG